MEYLHLKIYFYENVKNDFCVNNEKTFKKTGTGFSAGAI